MLVIDTDEGAELLRQAEAVKRLVEAYKQVRLKSVPRGSIRRIRGNKYLSTCKIGGLHKI